MDFRNLTPFPSLAFQGIDQYDQRFHVVVLRQTFDLTEQGPEYADEQTPLCEEDEWFGEPTYSGLRQESDYCHYKPKCDVVMLGSAHAPSGKPTASFPVRILMCEADTPMPLPEAPTGLNPFMAPSEERIAAWRAACEEARGKSIPGKILIDKTLIANGPRLLRLRWLPIRILYGAVSIATLGLLRPSTWRLTAPNATSIVPMRSDWAFGGYCRVLATDQAAKRLSRKLKKNAADRDPLVVSAFIANPGGKGWAESWWLRATKTRELPAPQWSYPDQPFRLSHFMRSVRGKLFRSSFNRIASFNAISKSHPDRARLTGTIDDAFIRSDKALPEDFDFRVWNAAPEDQQINFPKGGERIELTNVFPANMPGCSPDSKGNMVYRFTLPDHLPFVRVRMESGAMLRLPMQLDTIQIDTDRRQMTQVWRRIIGMDEAFPVRVLEVGILSPEQRRERTRFMTELDQIAEEKMRG